MQLRTLPLLLTLALVSPLALAGCDFGELGSAAVRFVSPGPDALVSGAKPEFVLALPKERGAVEVAIDNAQVDPRALRSFAREVRGPLGGLAPGLHKLRASVEIGVLLGGLPVRVSTTVRFEMAAPPVFTARGSVEQVHVTHATPGVELELLDAGGNAVASGVPDAQGSLIFREVAPGTYRVATIGMPRAASGALDVVAVADSTPSQAFYDSQSIQQGFGYITMRDGTKLSAFVSLPGPPENGPYPVLVNYSGYDPSQPVGALTFGGLNLCTLFGSQFPFFCDGSAAPESLVASMLGFATVGVNMRGTGCSGGAFDFFEPLQLTDGYDVIEAVAAQPWAGKVGMVGISYPGISQLFVASTHPPHLAAITPLAVISGTDTTLNPGGILNDGFALEWGTQVLDRADPYGHGWEQGRVDAGDTVCEENQLLHSQKVDIIQKAYDHPFYEPAIYDPLNPRTFVDTIDVPVFTSGAWQDEQTGNHFPDLWTRFTSAPIVRYTAYNGAHADGFTPQILAEVKNFLDFYVTGAVRPVPALARSLAPLLFESVFGVRVYLPPDRFTGYATFEEARAAYEAEPAVRLLMENGSGANGAPLGAPEASWEMDFDAWPPPSTVATRLYLHADGSLLDTPPTESAAASSFQHDDAKGHETYLVNDSFERALPDIQWLPEQPGRQVAFLTDPLPQDTVFAGHASADLWIQSTASDADLEVLLSEVRPDGQEMYIGSGWLRASQRALSPASSELKPVQTHLEADAAPLPAGEWTPVRIEIYPFAHAIRAGSRLRFAVSTPGGNKGRWKFDVLQLGPGVTHAVAHDAAHPSSVVLPVIPDVEVPTPLPPCPSLRSQPCRAFQPQVNAAFP